MSNFRRRLMMSLKNKEYTKLEYIESTGTQYIDTEYIPDYSKNINIEIVFEPTVSNSRYCLLSNYSVSNHLSLELSADNKGRCYYNTASVDSSTGTVSVSTQNTYLFNYNATNKSYTLTVNNQSISGNMNATGTSDSSMLAFVDQAKRFYIFKNSIKLYSLKISENGTLIKNFIPYYKKDINKAGMLDKVHNIFYENEGTGKFLYE